MPTDPKDWIALSLLPGVGPTTLRQLFQSDNHPAALLAAPDSRLTPVQQHLLQGYCQQQGPLAEQVEQLVASVAQQHAQILLADSNDYPPLLRASDDYPVILYVKGNLEALHLPVIAMVGSRKASRSGLRHAYQFAHHLADAGLVIASGLALGVDGAAHQAAVDAQRPTLAVMGTGIDRIYPGRHIELAEHILANGGALITELAPGKGPLAAHFPRRNRIISGLSVGVLVVEAAVRSGSLITARQALEQGREVFAIPGPIDHPGSRGCHQLIRQGAVLVQSAQDIMAELPALFGAIATAEATPYSQRSANAVESIHHRSATAIRAGATSVVGAANESLDQACNGTLVNQNSLTSLQKRILNCIDYTDTALELICLNTGLPTAQLQSELVELELLGLITMGAVGYQRL